LTVRSPFPIITDIALLFTRDAQKRLADVPKAERDQIMECLREIAASPDGRHPGTARLVNAEAAWRVRQGDWRAVYEIAGGEVVVIRVGHCREVYL
jgi:mRNA-degrading endonuclease RelE of RelBE toxin-antitoxin system